MKFIELFAGVGGFRYGLESERWLQNETNGDLSKSPCREGFQCVYANEWDKYAAAVYRYHWNDGTMHEADIRTVDPDGLPEHDLICGGFPCQSFSIAGKRRGFDDTRGTMFFEIMRIARACRTKYLFLENVKGLLNHKGGATFQTIITTLDELGYDCEWQVLNSKAYVPQNRERVFIIANLRGERRFQVFPIGETDNKYEELELTREPVIGCLRARGEEDMHSGLNLVSTKAQIRRLTPIECERLQAFPDNWTKYGLFDGKVKEISDTQRYKMMGNAVTTAVITDIKSRILRSK